MNEIEELRYLVLAAQREGNRMLTQRLRPLGLTASQAEVLRVLQDHQPLSLIELGGLLVCETGSPSRLVGGLVEAGLVERTLSEADKRMITLSLTREGEQTASEVAEVEAALYRTITEALNSEEISGVLAALRRLVAGRPAGEALSRRSRLSRLP
ncbi:MAG TPA: winged helix DNA-binding protein [Rubrobacteraceae bacterium]|nr:winged helix DNA-binding protein [Rubrobacteraceae bacterium]